MTKPVIAFGQQPCGFFPKRYLISKIRTALRLQKSLGGKIVFFFHDSDHDYRETIIEIEDRADATKERLNFEQENKIQKKYSPLYAKRIPAGWQEKMIRRLPRFVSAELTEIFASVQANTVADFCLAIYHKMGLLDGIEIIRSSEKQWREKALDIDDFFVDVDYEGEIVRARFFADDDSSQLRLHRGGDQFIDLPQQSFTKAQINPTRDTRFDWMQSIIHSTHYVMGAGEKAYFGDTSRWQEVTFIERDFIENAAQPWLDIS